MAVCIVKMIKSNISYLSDADFNDLLEANPDKEYYESNRWRKLRICENHEIRSRK